MTESEEFPSKLAGGPSQRSGIIMVSAGGLGDTVLFAHVFSLFTRLAEPGEPITLVLRHDAAKMGFLFDGRPEIVAVDFKRFGKSWTYRRGVLKDLRRRESRLALSTDFLRHPKLDERMVLEVGAEETAAMAPRSWAKYDQALDTNAKIYSRLFDSGAVHRDKILRWTDFANWLAETEAPPPVLRFPPEAEGRERSDEIILVPFSAVTEKQSSPLLFERIADKLAGQYKIVVAAAPKDVAQSPDFRPLLARPEVELDTTTFDVLAPRLASARLVVSVDTATMHLAVAVGAPTLCLASAAYVNEIVPYAEMTTPDNAHFIYTPMDCQGCLGACSLSLENGRFPCVARLDPTEVLSRIKGLLT